MRDILLTDMDRVQFLWSKIQDVNTARALAKRNTHYFMVEEKLWWELHSVFRDPTKLYALSTRPSSVTVAVGLWGSMDTLVHMEISFMASVYDLRDRACSELHCAAGSHYKLLKYNRVLRKISTGDAQLCGSAKDQNSRSHSKGKQTLWLAGVQENDTLCLKRDDPKLIE